MDIEESRRDDVTVLQLSGSIDSETAFEFEDAVTKVFQDGARRVVVDLGEVDQLTSSGIRVLLLLAKKLGAANGKLALSSLNEHVRTVLEISGLTGRFRIRSSIDEAVADVGADEDARPESTDAEEAREPAAEAGAAEPAGSADVQEAVDVTRPETAAEPPTAATPPEASEPPEPRKAAEPPPPPPEAVEAAEAEAAEDVEPEEGRDSHEPAERTPSSLAARAARIVGGETTRAPGATGDPPAADRRSSDRAPRESALGERVLALLRPPCRT